MRYSRFIIAAFAVLLVGGCAHHVSAAGNDDVKEIERIDGEADFAVSAAIEESKIVLLEPSDGTVLNEIPVTYDIYKVVINMTDEKNGYMMYCSTPESDRMKKIFYVTRDRWSTYSEMDISSLLDE